MLKEIAAGAMLALAVSGGALAQTPGLSCPDVDGPARASKEFVESYSAAQAALSAKRYEDALLKADAATPYAADARQLQYVLQIRSASYFALGDKANVAKTIADAQTLGCLSEVQLKQIRQMQSAQ